MTTRSGSSGAAEPCDVLVIGAGIDGAGIAHLAVRLMRKALSEQEWRRLLFDVIAPLVASRARRVGAEFGRIARAGASTP